MHYYKVCDSYARFCPPVRYPGFINSLVITATAFIFFDLIRTRGGMDNQWSNSRFYHSETAVNFGTPGMDRFYLENVTAVLVIEGKT